MEKIISQSILLLFLCSVTYANCQDSNPSIYSEIIPTSSGLPYNPVTDIRESFPAPNGKIVEVLVKGPVGTGTYSRPIRADETPDEYFPAVVQEAVNANAHQLVIPNGVYAFQGPTLCTDLSSPACNLPTSCNVNQYWNCQPHWTIGQYPQGQVTVPNSVTDLDIDFSGSELDFSAPVIGIWILEAQRLRLRNFTVDWPALPIASLGTIAPDPDNPGHNALVLDPEYPVTDKYWGGPVQIQAVDIWDGGPNSPDPPGVFDLKSNNDFETYFIFDNAPQPTYVGQTSAGAHTFSCESCHFQNSPSDPSCSMFEGCANFDIFAPGTRVIVRHYTYNGIAILVDWSNDINFENVKLRTGPGNGFGIGNNGGYRGFRIANSQITRAPGRLISIASGAIDLGLQADLILEGNDIGYQGDDSIAIHSGTSPIAGVEGSQITVTAVCDPDPMDSPGTGDALAFFDPNFVYMGTAHVVSTTGYFCGTLTLQLDHAIAGLNSNDNLLDMTQQPTARYIVRNNIMHECRCHAVLVNAPYGLIDNNLTFQDAAGSFALAGGSGQGPGATNLTFSNNVVRDPGEWAQYNGAISLIAPDANGNIITEPVYEKINIQGNSIVNTPGPAIIATSTRYFSIESNRITNANQAKTSPGYFGTLSTLDSILIDESDNGTVCNPYLEGTTTGLIGIDPSDERILLESNCTF
jgi:hypothetical protein